MAEKVVRTVDEMLQVIAPALRRSGAPALREILTTEELALTIVRARRQPADRRALRNWPTLTDGDALDEETLLEVHTLDDWKGRWMQGRETPAEMYTRFRSELQDLVAESTFGWGQLRP